jgi:hypothetical protein
MTVRPDGSDPDEYHEPDEYFVNEGKMDEIYKPSKGDTFLKSTQCRDFVINGLPIGEVVRLQDYSDKEAEDRAFCLATSSDSTIYDLLRRFSRSRMKVFFLSWSGQTLPGGCFEEGSRD